MDGLFAMPILLYWCVWECFRLITPISLLFLHYFHTKLIKSCLLKAKKTLVFKQLIIPLKKRKHNMPFMTSYALSLFFYTVTFSADFV